MTSTREIRVGDHVRCASDDFDLNVVWEVVGANSKSLALRFDVVEPQGTVIRRRRARREDVVLVAEQARLSDAMGAATE